MDTRKIDSAYGEIFTDERLDISGATILSCVFERCHIVINEPALSSHNVFDKSCTYSVPVHEFYKWLHSWEYHTLLSRRREEYLSWQERQLTS